ncbi:MAG: ribonuclease P protein component [Halobacteriovoraceae bacterium]|nr:ribonuclease P protein component [Halobacteriovoraceae bacterium]
MVQSKNQTFSRNFRLRLKEHFTNLRSKNLRYRSHSFIAYYKRNSLSYSRIATSVSKKNGNAVVRNKIKRSIKESFRRSSAKSSGYDILIVANNHFFNSKNNLQVSIEVFKTALIDFFENISSGDKNEV